MCQVCEKAKMPQYAALIEAMLEEDKKRLEFSKVMSSTLRPLQRSIYSSINWPVKMLYPMFEARAAYAVPNNYFQNLTIDGERLGNSFAHGAMRSVFFAGERLMLFSKSVNFRDGKEFFTSFLLAHFEKDEYKQTIGAGEIRISADIEKPMINLLTQKAERKRITFSFIHQPVAGRIVSREQAAASSRFRIVYEKYGGVQLKAGSMDIEGYAITVPHFSPHPYLLQLHEEFGYASNRDFQEHVADYFETHLTGQK